MTRNPITPASTIQEKFKFYQEDIYRATRIRSDIALLSDEWRRKQLRQFLHSNKVTAEIEFKTPEGTFRPRLSVRPNFKQLGVPIGFDIAAHIAWMFDIGHEPYLIHIGGIYARFDDWLADEILSAANMGIQILNRFNAEEPEKAT